MRSEAPGSGRLLPREHGAYAYAAFPIAGGLLMGEPSLASFSLAAAAVAFFLAHEPLAVLLGFRGQRLRDALGASARSRLPLLLAVGTAAGTVGLVTAPPIGRLLALVPLGFALLLLLLVAKRRQKTLPGELVVLAAFSTMVLPLAVSGGVPPARAGLIAGIWIATFAPPTVAVHGIKARHRSPEAPGPAAAAAPILAALVVLAALALPILGVVPWVPALAPMPVALVTLAVTLRPFHPRDLRRLGWSLVGAGTLSLLLTLVG